MDVTQSMPHIHHHKGLLLIAIMKLAKGPLLVLAGFGALSLLGKDVGDVAESLIRWLHFDPEKKFFVALLEKLSFVDDHRLKQVSFYTFLYAGLLYTEGFGLWFEKRWAEWLTVIATSSFIPIEIYEIIKHIRLAKIVLLAVNVAIVWYLIIQLKQGRHVKRSSGEPRLTDSSKAATPFAD